MNGQRPGDTTRCVEFKQLEGTEGDLIWYQEGNLWQLVLMFIHPDSTKSGLKSASGLARILMLALLGTIRGESGIIHRQILCAFYVAI